MLLLLRRAAAVLRATARAVPRRNIDGTIARGSARVRVQRGVPVEIDAGPVAGCEWGKHGEAVEGGTMAYGGGVAVAVAVVMAVTVVMVVMVMAAAASCTATVGWSRGAAAPTALAAGEAASHGQGGRPRRAEHGVVALTSSASTLW